jgi:hypothetical protein
MNTRNLLIASLLGGGLSLLLVNTPVVNLVNCLLCVGFWGPAILAVWVYKRLTGSVTLGQAVAIGALAGVWAGVIGFFLSFAGLAGAEGLLNSLRPLLPADSLPNLEQQAPAGAGMLITLVGVLVDIALGALGGLIGGSLFKPKPATA